MWLTIPATILVAFYIMLIRIFRTGWKGMDYFQPRLSDMDYEEIQVSVIVTCKNEEQHLPELIKKLQAQSYQKFELVLVNDHSEDRTVAIMQQASALFSSFIYVEAKAQGKKKALAEGINACSGNLIIITDADCQPPKRWIETIIKFQTESPSDLIICPVKLKGEKKVFSILQQFEFTSLVASGAGAAGAHFPILCNAANLAFTKKAWIESIKDLKNEEQSGDDIFLLQSIKKRKGIIRFLKSTQAFTVTEPAPNLKAFFRQRRRWAGKSTAYSDPQLIFTACTVLGISLTQLALLIGGCFNILYLYLYLFFFLIKYWTDLRFLSEVSDFFSLPSVPVYSFLLSAIYPFYIALTGISALLFKPKKWK